MDWYLMFLWFAFVTFGIPAILFMASGFIVFWILLFEMAKEFLTVRESGTREVVKDEASSNYLRGKPPTDN